MCGEYSILMYFCLMQMLFINVMLHDGYVGFPDVSKPEIKSSAQILICTMKMAKTAVNTDNFVLSEQTDQNELYIKSVVDCFGCHTLMLFLTFDLFYTSLNLYL